MYKSATDSYTITFSNKNAGLTITKVATGRFVVKIPEKYTEIGIPRIITHYCSDKAGSDGSTVGSIAGVINNTFHPGGSNPQFQCQLHGSSVFGEIDSSTLETTQYIALYFTGNNADSFVDPVFVQFSLICL